MRVKASQLRELGDEELAAKENQLKRELFDLRYQQQLGRVEKPHRINQVRRELAVIKTILNERKRTATKA